jgi:UDP-glucose 4-epimerase
VKVLVTGGTGFIGSHITDLLAQLGYQVIVVDNLSQSNLSHLNRKARFYKLDITDSSLYAVLAREKPDVIIHQAAQVNVHQSVKDPISDVRTNILGTLNLLNGAVKLGIKKMIYASTCAVYGEPQTDPIDETHPVNPSSGYGLSKWTGECYIRLYHQMHGLSYTILRYANVYGPRQGVYGEGGVVSIFNKQLENGSSAVIYGDGTQTRDFVYVKDVARANVQALAKGDQDTFNIGTGQAVSILELYQLMEELIQVKRPPKHADARPGDIRHSRLDNQKAKLILDWSPSYTLKEGLKETLGIVKA